MGNFKRKITSADQRDIETMAKGLPVMARYNSRGEPIYKNQQIDGVELLSRGVTKTANGARPIAGTTYVAPVLQYVNHTEQMLLIFRHEGMDGCKAYANEVNARKKAMDQDAIKAAARQKWYNWPRIFISRMWFRLWYRRESK